MSTLVYGRSEAVVYSVDRHGLAEPAGSLIPGTQTVDYSGFSSTDDLVRLVQAQAPVLVQCHAGRSRSAVVVAGYLMTVRSVNVTDAVASVAARREINMTRAPVELLHKLKT